MVKKLRPMGDRLSPHARLGVKRPFQSGVADIECQNCHRGIMPLGHTPAAPCDLIDVYVNVSVSARLLRAHLP